MTQAHGLPSRGKAEPAPPPTCVGRAALLDELAQWLAGEHAMAWWLHGIGGIGKTLLARAFASQARTRHHAVAWIDGDLVEPTPRGICAALAEALDIEGATPEQLSEAVAMRPPGTLIVFDTFERCRQIDTWVRRSLLPVLPRTARLLVVSRDAPVPQWALADPPHVLHRSVELAPLEAPDARRLLLLMGAEPGTVEPALRLAQGHPLALRLAARLGHGALMRAHDAQAVQPVIEALVRLFHAEVSDPQLRQALHRVAVVRRVTVSLLRALVPGCDPHALIDALAALPMCALAADGLSLHDAARTALAAHFKALDPAGYRDARRVAWKALQAESQSADRAELWRYTADLLYLVEAPSVRDVFFPRGSEVIAVEPARRADEASVMGIAARHAGSEEAALLRRWWQALPDSFRVTRDAQDGVSGYLCAARWAELPAGLVEGDPLCRAWRQHLADDPVEAGEEVLILRSKLCADAVEQHSPTDAALTMDLKRAYVELRPRLRRLYCQMADESSYADFFRQAGFRALPECTVMIGGRERLSMMLDFGPGSVDGWLSQLVALSVVSEPGPAVQLDTAARELRVDGQRVGLTALEFELMRHLVSHAGEAVKRGDLLDEVWGPRYEGGSNVVDVAIRSLRRKLGVRAHCIETVPRFGYRFRPG